MKQIIRKKNSNRKLLLTVVGVLLVIGALTALAKLSSFGPFAENTSKENTISFDEPSDDQKEAGEQAKQDTLEGDAAKPSDSSSGAQQPTASKQVAVEITNINPGENSVSIKTLIQEISSSGTCTLTLSKAGQSTITRTAKTQALPSSSTCQGFNVTGLSKGQWNLKLEYKSDKSQGNASEVVTI